MILPNAMDTTQGLGASGPASPRRARASPFPGPTEAQASPRWAGSCRINTRCRQPIAAVGSRRSPLRRVVIGALPRQAGAIHGLGTPAFGKKAGRASFSGRYHGRRRGRHVGRLPALPDARTAPPSATTARRVSTPGGQTPYVACRLASQVSLWACESHLLPMARTAFSTSSCLTAR